MKTNAIDNNKYGIAIKYNIPEFKPSKKASFPSGSDSAIALHIAHREKDSRWRKKKKEIIYMYFILLKVYFD